MTQNSGVVEQTVSLLGSAASYMRLPAIASTVCLSLSLPWMSIVTD